ncbi:MAG: DUF2252 domain-containing protein [Candidatus Korobacteraceae bacterium]
MSPRAKKTPPKSKAEKPSSSKSVPKTSKKPHASLHSVLEGLRTPGDRSGKFDLRSVNDPWQKRRDIGKGLRVGTPRESHADTKPVANRPDPLDLLAADNVGRQENLIPLRMGRMAASPFTFLRGAACVMAWDLSRTPTSGIHVVMCGDAHINNFGMYGTPQRDVIFDLNDFDEVTIGPWEWDLKRLVASVNVAARENGLNKKERAEAVMRAVEGYRFNIDRLKDMGVLDIWYLHAYPDRENPLVKMDAKSKAVIGKCVAKARQTTNATLLTKISERGVAGGWRLAEDPPVLTHLDGATSDKVIAGLNEYAQSLPLERRYMLSRYHVVDVAHRVVGVGSVGTRAYLALLFGSDDNDPLFLQIKECVPPAHAPYVPPLSKEYVDHEGKRVVVGQRALQASSDIMLGVTRIDGRPYFVRQMKNMKASIPVEWLTGDSFNFYAWACGTLLARAHARAGDAAAIAGYCGGSAVLDRALATWAEAYGDQTERDHEQLVKAIKSGKVKATIEA